MTSIYTSNQARSGTPYRTSSTRQQAAPPPRPITTDDYERWYTEPAPNNRMVLALSSGIDSEISWALDRLCRLCHNEQFVLRALPGLTEALFEWPNWYVKGGAFEIAGMAELFALPEVMEKRKRHALESMFILRNAALNAPNAEELGGRRLTQELILLALHKLRPDSDANVDFMLNIVELLQSIASTSVLPPPTSHYLANPIIPLQHMASSSSDRSIIVACLSTLTLLLSNPPNMAHLSATSPTLDAAIRFLPLLGDKGLVEVCLNFLYAHLSYPPMSKAFLLHPQLASTLRLLVMILLSEQVEETVTFEVAGPVFTIPLETQSIRDHELTQEELEQLLPTPEPQRCYDWMKTMFIADPEQELTQVEFWTLYRNVFQPYQEQYMSLVASDVIKNVTVVFPQAQAMVLPGPPQRFVVRGVARRKDNDAATKFQCRWDRSECGEATFTSTGELYEHVLEAHINTHPQSEVACSWATCSHPPLSKALIRGHILTHLPSMQPEAPHPTQDNTITLPHEGFPHPVSDPTTRPPPPPRSATVTYRRPVADPPSMALTALLCIRILFRASFASADAAPRVDEDHFGFPGIIEDVGEKEGDEAVSSGTDIELEGERRGRKAFGAVRHLLEGVRLFDETLMGWIMEMVDAGLSGTT